MEKIEFFKKFRGVDFVNREEEINYFLEYFSQEPENILLVYGPKSTGKTTLIEYVVENYLLKDKQFNASYINFRGKMISNYENFIESFIKPKSLLEKLDLVIDFHFVKINSQAYKKVKNKELDFFEAVKKEFLNNKKKNIIIIDEIQMLKDIYINGEKILLDEFLNFCVTLTKERHISHVVVLTSDTLFLDEIYNNSNLQKASEFRLIWHLRYEDVKKWLVAKGFNEEEINLIYEYLGGCAPDIKRMLTNYKRFNSLKEYLEEEAQIAANKIIFERNKGLTNREFNLFLEVAKIIVKEGKFVFKEENEKKRKELFKVVSKFAKIEIFFYDSIKNIVYPNSQIYKKAFELLLEERK